MKPRIFRWLGLCLLIGLLQSGPVFAQAADVAPTPDTPAVSGRENQADAPAAPAYVGRARQAIDSILATPEFDRTRIVKVPKFKGELADGEKNFFESLAERLINRLRGNPQGKPLDWGRFVARAGQVVLWLLVFGLIVLLAVYAKRWLPFFGWRRTAAGSPPLTPRYEEALEIAAALPADIAKAAERCWKEGKKAEALSLLYRGTIELLAARYRVELPQGATEEEVRLLVGNAVPSLKDDFSEIARAWLRLAYAHRPPADIVGLLAGFRRLQQSGEMAA